VTVLCRDKRPDQRSSAAGGNTVFPLGRIWFCRVAEASFSFSFSFLFLGFFWSEKEKEKEERERFARFRTN
jgi:hypothetical protein